MEEAALALTGFGFTARKVPKPQRDWNHTICLGQPHCDYCQNLCDSFVDLVGCLGHVPSFPGKTDNICSLSMSFEVFDVYTNCELALYTYNLTQPEVLSTWTATREEYYCLPSGEKRAWRNIVFTAPWITKDRLERTLDGLFTVVRRHHVWDILHQFEPYVEDDVIKARYHNEPYCAPFHFRRVFCNEKSAIKPFTSQYDLLDNTWSGPLDKPNLERLQEHHLDVPFHNALAQYSRLREAHITSEDVLASTADIFGSDSDE